jgi:hypothetical protein
MTPDKEASLGVMSVTHIFSQVSLDAGHLSCRCLFLVCPIVVIVENSAGANTDHISDQRRLTASSKVLSDLLSNEAQNRRTELPSPTSNCPSNSFQIRNELADATEGLRFRLQEIEPPRYGLEVVSQPPIAAGSFGSRLPFFRVDGLAITSERVRLFAPICN